MADFARVLRRSLKRGPAHRRRPHYASRRQLLFGPHPRMALHRKRSMASVDPSSLFDANPLFTGCGDSVARVAYDARLSRKPSPISTRRRLSFGTYWNCGSTTELGPRTRPG